MKRKPDAIVFLGRSVEHAPHFELTLRERHALMLARTKTEPTIYRLCIEAGYPVDNITQLAAYQNVSRDKVDLRNAHRTPPKAREEKSEPLIFLEA